MEKVQWEVTKESWDKIMALGLTKWQPGEMGTGTFFLETPDELIKVKEGDWVVKTDEGNFIVQEQNKNQNN